MLFELYDIQNYLINVVFAVQAYPSQYHKQLTNAEPVGECAEGAIGWCLVFMMICSRNEHNES